MRVEGPHGIVTISNPDPDCMVIVARAGANIRGTLYFHAALLQMSTDMAQRVVDEGKADKARVLNDAGAAAFVVGETYTTRSACDYDCIYSFKIIARTEKTLTIEEHGKTYKRGVRAYDGSERCSPHGRFSMSPVISADRKGEC